MPTLDRLLLWIERRQFPLDRLASDMGYKLSYVLRIVEGRAPITDGFIGAFTRVYGPRAAAEAFNLELEPASTQ